MNTQRFNSNKEWWAYNGHANSPFMGLTHLINDLVEHFKPEKLSWCSLLSMCNDLVERSATENYMFLRFSMIDSETIELITN